MIDENMGRRSFPRRARSTIAAAIYVGVIVGGGYATGHHLFAVIALAVSTILWAIESDVSRPDTIPNVDMKDLG